MDGLQLEIVTPDKVVLETSADYVGAPGVDGDFGILPHHIPLLSAISIGELYYRQGTQTHWAFLSGGFLEVNDNKVTILAESAELATEIDIDRAQQARERAEARMRSENMGTDPRRAEAALRRALARIQVASR